MKSLLVRYWVQIATYVVMVNNSFSAHWMGDQTTHYAINGDKGFPTYWHWYVTFEVYIQSIIMLAILCVYVVFPQTGSVRKYTIVTIGIFILLSIVEGLIFQYSGSGEVGEGLYYHFLVGYTSLLLIAAVKLKVWNH